MKVTTKIDENASKFARYGRPLAVGNHPGEVLEFKEEVVTKDEIQRNQITLVFSVNADPVSAPEGPVKVDFRATEGHWTMDNLVKTFFPDAYGKEGAEIDTKKLKGAKCKVSTKVLPANPEKNWKEKAAIQRLAGPVVFAAEDAF